MKELYFLKNKINIYIINSILILLVVFSFGVRDTSATSVMNGLKETVSTGLLGGTTVNETNLKKAGVINDLPTAIGNVVGAVLSFLGIIFLILMIYGGFTWMFARGNDQNVTKAKELIQAAIIGLIIVLSAYAITSYVGKSLM